MGLKHYSDGWENSDRMSEIMTLAYGVKDTIIQVLPLPWVTWGSRAKRFMTF